jgi:hypothetical protein
MNKEHFLKLAKQTPQKMIDDGFVFIGENPEKHGIPPFNGLLADKCGRVREEKVMHWMGNSTRGSYYMKMEEWEPLFGPLNGIENKIEQNEKEIARLLEENKKLKAEKEKEDFMFKEVGNVLDLRGTLVKNKRVTSAFLQIRKYGEYKYKGFFLGIPAQRDNKWKIVTDSEGAQVLVPDFVK